MITAGLALTGLTTGTAQTTSAHTAGTQNRGAGATTTPATAAGGQDAASRAGPPGPPARPGNSQLVSFGGYQISVPAGWPVYSLTADPARCVRFDRHAVYLGRPGANQQCPAHLVGRVATVTLTAGAAAPVGGSWQPAASGQAGPVSLSPGQVRDGATLAVGRADGQAQAVFGERALTVTATYGDDAALTGQILRTVRPANAVGTAAAAPVPPAGETSAIRLTAGAASASGNQKGHRGESAKCTKSSTTASRSKASTPARRRLFG